MEASTAPAASLATFETSDSSDETFVDYGKELNQKIERMRWKLIALREQLDRTEDDMAELLLEKAEAIAECGRCDDCSMCCV